MSDCSDKSGGIRPATTRTGSAWVGKPVQWSRPRGFGSTFSVPENQQTFAGMAGEPEPSDAEPKTSTSEKPKAGASKAKSAAGKEIEKAAEKKSSGTGKKKPKPARRDPWTFPKHPLEDAIRIAKAVEEKNAGNAMPVLLLAKAVGYNLASDWRFQALLRSANQYGLVNGSGTKSDVTLAPAGEDIVAPSSPVDRKKALVRAFRNVEEFAKVADFYGDKKIPEDEYFFNTLTRTFDIPRDRAEVFADVFTSNLSFLRSFAAAPSGDPQEAPDEGPFDVLPKEEPLLVRASDLREPPRVREFLDQCFVMMPFGSWFDRYYSEIYVPAIREAGFEPVRADELFSTGSVMEQIWEQIEKSKVLLADLTDRNPNVFYELGLAHAAKKPVVFTAGDIGDVPFDLRHLRVIVYETREPDWAGKLRQLVTDYLKNAVRDPQKSIPHPFRGMIDGDDAGESED